MNHIIVGITLLGAVYYDRQENRIPNLLCMSATVTGAVYVLFSGGMKTGIYYLLWAVGLCVCFFPLWMMKGVGGGDVKLLMTLGFLLRENTVPFLICSGICVGLHGFLLLVRRKNYRHRIRLLVQYVMECREEKRWKAYPFNAKTDYADGGIRISYGCLAGHVLALLLNMYQ